MSHITAVSLPAAASQAAVRAVETRAPAATPAAPKVEDKPVPAPVAAAPAPAQPVVLSTATLQVLQTVHAAPQAAVASANGDAARSLEGDLHGKNVRPAPAPAPAPTPVTLRARGVETPYDAAAPDRAQTRVQGLLQAQSANADARAQAQAQTAFQLSQNVVLQGQAALGVLQVMSGMRQPQSISPASLRV